jgi:hypothetical protein
MRHRRSLVKCLFLLLTCASLQDFAKAYRLGEAINTDYRLDQEISDVLQSQMPLFGMDSSAQFPFGSMQKKSQTFAMTFEDGLWTIPSVPLQNRDREYLQSLQVDLLYSKAGWLQSVSNQVPVYSKEQPKYFRVDYKWTAEDAPHLTASINFLVLVVFAACIFFLMEACGITADDVASHDDDSVASGWTVVKQHSR